MVPETTVGLQRSLIFVLFGKKTVKVTPSLVALATMAELTQCMLHTVD